MSKSEGPDLARILARKAEGDAKAMRRLASDPEVDDEAVGFHAQQAVEKWLKAVIAARGLSDKKTRHDLGRLLEILAEGKVGPPPGADWLDELTIYSVAMRYEELLDLEPLDRDAVDALVTEVGQWAVASIG